MQRIRTSLLAGLALAAVSMSTLAQGAGSIATPRIDQRQANQERRIDQGIASGQLTRHEAHRLNAQQGSIERAENRAKADGVVTAKEHQHLQHKQDHASRHIHRQKHDRQDRAAPAKLS
jgi:hypothetical protein